MNVADNKLANQFSLTQLGAITVSVDPVSNLMTLEDMQDVDFIPTGIHSVPIEVDGRVVGLLKTSVMKEKGHSFLESLRGRPLDTFMEKNTPFFDAREHVEKVLNSFMRDEEIDTLDDIIVTLGSSYLGVINIGQLSRYVNELREKELEKARYIQQSMLRNSIAENIAFKVYPEIELAHHTGGDFYYITDLNPSVSLVSCYDVSGKDFSASLVTSIIRTYFASSEYLHKGNEADISSLMKGLNKVLFDLTPSEIFVVAAFVFIDKKMNKIRVFNFGYNPVKLFRENEGAIQSKELKAQFPPLGLDEEIDLSAASEVQIPLRRGLKLMVYSDGITDIQNTDGIRFGDKRLIEFLDAKGGESGEYLSRQLKKTLDDFRGDTPPADDSTFVFIDIFEKYGF